MSHSGTPGVQSSRLIVDRSRSMPSRSSLRDALTHILSRVRIPPRHAISFPLSRDFGADADGLGEYGSDRRKVQFNFRITAAFSSPARSTGSNGAARASSTERRTICMVYGWSICQTLLLPPLPPSVSLSLSVSVYPEARRKVGTKHLFDIPVCQGVTRHLRRSHTKAIHCARRAILSFSR